MIDEAYEFAERHFKENDIRRKYTNEPYMRHPQEVAFMVRGVGGSDAMVMAALLHDTVEDTPVTIGQIYDKFGADVGFLVQCLTDITVPSDGNMAKRQRIEAQRLSMCSNAVKTIKLADLISNSESIFKYDKKFAPVYAQEMFYLLTVLRGGNSILLNKARQIICDWEG